MTFSGKKEALYLFAGDLVGFCVALWLMLFVRYQELPRGVVFLEHIQPFSILFAVWVLVFFIAGLYERHTLPLQSKLPSVILNAQIVNTLVAITFFYLIPYFGITPKTNLFIYLVISFVVILVWRIEGQRFLMVKEKQNAILIGESEEARELRQEVNNNPRYGIKFVSSIDLNTIQDLDFQEEILKTVYSEGVSIIAADLRSENVEPILPHFYNLIFSNVHFIDMYKIYEDIFNRIPLSLVKHNWFLENVSTTHNPTFDFLKRAMDIILSLVLGLISLVVYPFCFLAIKLDDGGPVFFVQDRIGKNNKIIKVIKFRSFKVHNNPDGVATNNETTKVGAFLRRTRIDELPQLWNVLKDDLSLIGPRPEIPSLVKLYEKEVPYYNIRHLIKPGLSGWAQLYHNSPPKFNPDNNETKKKLSFDLYYIKNRSFVLDVKIALKTLKALLSRSGM